MFPNEMYKALPHEVKEVLRSRAKRHKQRLASNTSNTSNFKTKPSRKNNRKTQSPRQATTLISEPEEDPQQDCASDQENLQDDISHAVVYNTLQQFFPPRSLNVSCSTYFISQAHMAL